MSIRWDLQERLSKSMLSVVYDAVGFNVLATQLLIICSKIEFDKSINILDVNEIISLSSHDSNHINLSSVDKFSKLVYNLFIILKYFALQLSIN
jgi:hypothetical protein